MRWINHSSICFGVRNVGWMNESLGHSLFSFFDSVIAGFVLFVEGGNIDEAHHLNKAPQSLEDVVQFDMAVAKAQEMLDTKDTLIVVTADHSHGFNINGYADRESPVTG